AFATAGAGEFHVVRIGKLDALFVGGQADRFRFERNQPEGGIVVDDDFDRQFVVHSGQKLAHQHVEAAVASAMTWRDRSSAWMPLAWPNAVPTAALLN